MFLPKESMPREKLLAKGAASLSDAELLAIFLRTGNREKNVLELSDHLLKEFGSLGALFGCDEKSFYQHKGLGQATYVQLQAVLEMSKRYLAETLSRSSVLSNPKATVDYLLHHLKQRDREAFLLLYLDNQHCVLGQEVLFEGTLNASMVYPREVVKQVLKFGANAVILAHNHPSGLAEPSEEDKRVTARLEAALELIDVRVLDHIVLGDGQYVSFAERGWIRA